MTQIADDTQPRSPLRTAPPTQPDGPGCLVYTVVGVGILLMSTAVVLLAAAAGWTEGQRVAQGNAAATQNAEVQVQLALIESDIAQGNPGWLASRIDYLATLDVPEAASAMATGTAVFLTQQPTATLTPTATTTATASPQATLIPSLTPTINPNAAAEEQLAQRLETAREHVALAQWSEAINELDIIISTDEQFQRSTVRALMSRALNAYARQLYTSGDLAEAVTHTDWAEDLGPLDEGLSVEREVANSLLSARALVGTSNYALTIDYLLTADSLASPAYMNGEIRTLLRTEYAAYGDALLMTQPCDAVFQYTNALNINFDGSISSKRDTAQDYCDNGTPTPEGFVPTPDAATPSA